MRDLKNKSKLMKTSLVALTLATTVVSQTNVNVYAEEVVNDSQEETEIVNTENTDSLEESTEEESTDIQEESNTETTETNEVSEAETTPALEDTSVNEEIETLSGTNNAGDFNVTGDYEEGWTYDSSTNILTFNHSGNYTIEGNGQETEEQIHVAHDFSGTIIIKNVNAKTMNVENTANLTLMLDGTITLREGLRFANATTGTLTIDSNTNGSLTATGVYGTAGIGGGYNEEGNNITIEGGSVVATGGDYGAGIGGGDSGVGSHITINGGTVNATGGKNGAGIGGGNQKEGSNIIINGGIVTANSTSEGAGIGGGSNGAGNNIKITNGKVKVTGGYFAAGIGGGYQREGEKIEITNGMVDTTGGFDGAGIGGGYNSSGIDITINGGTVVATGGNSAAGIGGGYKGYGEYINIYDATVTATGGYNGAGIGGGDYGYGTGITIYGGTVNATGGECGAGIGGGHNEYGTFIDVFGGTVTATATSGGAGIGGGSGNAGGYMNIYGGTVTATATSGGAGIGGGLSGTAINVSILGGTVTATATDNGAGIGGGAGTDSSSNIITIEGGSIKASSIDNPSRTIYALYLAKLENQSGVNEVQVDGKNFTRQGDHPDGDGAFYLYVTGQDHTITTPKGDYKAIWNGQNGFVIKQNSPIPTIAIDKTTANSITVKPLENQETYGEAEYSLDNQNWQSSNVLTGLDANTEYIVYARYKGNDTYFQSEAGNIKVTTMKKDGKTLLEEKTPAELSGVYGQILLNVALPDDWTWVDGNTDLSVGTQSYTARFDTTDYEKEYDFTGIEGYNAEQHCVKMNLTIDVLKADSSIKFKTLSLDKKYDGNDVNNPDVEKTGSTKDVTFTWYKKDGNDWKELSSAPADAGNYKVVASVEADDKYNGASAEKEFVISQTTNTWTDELSIEGWTYGEQPNAPIAESKYGEVKFTYSDKEDGTYTDTIPTNVGTWYVKATVASNKNYTGLESIESFEIKKADSSITITTSSLDKAYDGKAVEIPEYTTSGSNGQVTIKWQKNTGTDSSPVWEDLKDAPSIAGSYRVVVELAGDNNYKSASTTKTFAIYKSENKWIEGPSITGWTYGEQSNAPVATSKYGTVAFTYSDSKDGTYTDTVPTNAGTYYVKATVVGNENYSSLEDIVEFTIKKAESSISFKEGYTLNKTYDGKAVVIDKKDLETKGSTGNIVFTYEEKIDDAWTVLENAPTKAGTYRVTATLNEDANHNSSTSKALEFVIEKADTVLEFSTDNMNKTYDTEAVSEPTIKKTGSSNEVVFTWYKKEGNDWKELSSAPADAGNYKVVASVEADDNYNAASVEMEFTISQATNAWTNELYIKGWTFGEQSNAPIATSKYGTVTFTYSDSKDGTYTETVPTEAGTYYVKAIVAGNENYTGLESIKSFEIKKVNSSIVITTSSLDKEYDGNTVNSPNVEKSGSTKDVTFTWYQEDEDGWKELSSSPTNAGSYKVVANIKADDNYNGASAELEFVISQTINEWAEELSIEGWTYGDEAKKPIATSKYGAVTFTYSDTKERAYIDAVPTNAGTYYVKATVAGNENYTGLEEIMSFEISKAVPEYSVPTDLTIEQGNSLSTVKLPKGFTWKDGTQKADKLGKQTFKAIYTPEDINNYQTVDTDITVNVVAKTSSKDENDDSKTEGTNTSTQTNQMMWVSIATLSVLFISALSVLKLRKHK